MKDKLLKLKDLIRGHKKITIIVSGVLIVAIILSEGVYIKYQHDIILKVSNTKKDTISVQSTQNKSKEAQSNTNKEIKLGEPFSVTTTSGNYNFTIEKAINSKLTKFAMVTVTKEISCSNSAGYFYFSKSLSLIFSNTAFFFLTI